VTLRWILQQPKLLAIPKSENPDHIRSNFDIFDFSLSAEEMDRIFDLERGERLIDPSFAPDWAETS
jgi:2,5-diketo-D-gluconate reductase B